MSVTALEGLVIALAVGRRYNSAALIRVQDTSCEICGRQSDIGAGFLRVFLFQ
jgi:hypothetical protein